MRVRELMTEEPLRVSASSSLTAAVALLALGDVRHLPVVDNDGRVVGVLSERDALGFLVPGEDKVDENLEAGLERPVAEVMSEEPLTIGPDEPAEALVDLLLTSKVGAVPVVEKDRTLVGIVSYVDVLRAVRDRL